MCEPAILARTGLTVLEHHARTIRSYLELHDFAPDLPWLPWLPWLPVLRAPCSRRWTY